MPPNSKNFIKKRVEKKYKGGGTRPIPSKEKTKSKKEKKKEKTP